MAVAAPGRPIDSGDEQRVRYRGRNVVERGFNKIEQWRGIAMRSERLARNYHVGLCLAATLRWVASRPDCGQPETAAMASISTN